jgi:hypothetical protein
MQMIYSIVFQPLFTHPASSPRRKSPTQLLKQRSPRCHSAQARSTVPCVYTRNRLSNTLVLGRFSQRELSRLTSNVLKSKPMRHMDMRDGGRLYTLSLTPSSVYGVGSLPVGKRWWMDETELSYKYPTEVQYRLHTYSCSLTDTVEELGRSGEGGFESILLPSK